MTQQVQIGLYEDTVFISRAAAVVKRIPASVNVISVLDDGVVRRLVRAAFSDPAALTTADGQRWKPTGQATFKLFGCDPGFTAAQNNAGIAAACLYGNIRVTNAVWQCSVPLVWAQNSAIVWDYGAKIRSTYRPNQAAQDTAVVAFGEGSVGNHFELSIPGGITYGTASMMGVVIKDGCSFLSMTSKADSYNDAIITPTGDYERRGAFRLEGANITIGHLESHNHRAVVRVRGADRVEIKRVNFTRCSMGINLRDVRNSKFLGGVISSVPFKDQTRAHNDNGLIKGENGILIGGAQDCIVSGFTFYDTLEHGIRVGAGQEIMNQRVTISECEFYRTWGVGLKVDDDDAHTNVDLNISNITVVDAGRDNAAARAPYSWETDNWSIVATSQWGNKEGVAIRNAERVKVSNIIVRKSSYNYSARHCLWVERCQQVSVSNVFGQAPLLDGYLVQTSGFPARDINANGVSISDAGRYCVAFQATANGDVFNRVSAMGIFATGAGAAEISFTARPDGSSPLAGLCVMQGARRGTTGGQVISPSIASDVRFGNLVTNVAA